jgi:hypothetical protein
MARSRMTHQRHRWLIIAVMHNRVFADRRKAGEWGCRALAVSR